MSLYHAALPISVASCPHVAVCAMRRERGEGGGERENLGQTPSGQGCTEEKPPGAEPGRSDTVTTGGACGACPLMTSIEKMYACPFFIAAGMVQRLGMRERSEGTACGGSMAAESGAAESGASLYRVCSQRALTA